MASVGQAMIIDAVDQADIPIGTIRRAEVFQKHANFRVAHVFVFNSNGDLLLQRLALTRERNPGAWGSSVAAYLFSSEGYFEAARRRVGQELGIPGASVSFLAKTEMIDDGCLKFISLFRCFSEGPFRFDSSQVDKAEFVSINQIIGMIAGRTRKFTPTFLRVFELYRSLAE
jgi:isopentenyl-diphosphate delta-isomerase